MISETIIKAAEIEKAVRYMADCGANSVEICTIPAGSVVSMRNGDLVITPAYDGPKPSSVTVGCPNYDAPGAIQMWSSRERTPEGPQKRLPAKLRLV